MSTGQSNGAARGFSGLPTTTSEPMRSRPGGGGGYAGPRRPRKRPSRKLVLLLVAGAVAFLAISAGLARFLSTENVERDDEVALLQAQARGDVNGMLAKLRGCRESATCTSAVRANAARLRRPGAVKILSLKSSTAYSLGAATGKTRLAWTVIGRLPVVQCVEVRRSGNVFSGIKVSLVSLSAPIENEADC